MHTVISGVDEDILRIAQEIRGRATESARPHGAAIPPPISPGQIVFGEAALFRDNRAQLPEQPDTWPASHFGMGTRSNPSL